MNKHLWVNRRLRQSGEGKAADSLSSLSLFFTEDSIAFIVPLQRYLWLAQMWMRRGYTCFCPTQRQNPHLPLLTPGTQPPVDEKWRVEQRWVLFYRLKRGGLACAIPWKQESERGLCTGLTPNWLSDNPVIIVKNTGTHCGKAQLFMGSLDQCASWMRNSIVLCHVWSHRHIQCVSCHWDIV